MLSPCWRLNCGPVYYWRTVVATALNMTPHAILNFAFIAAFILLVVGLEKLTLKATISSDYSMQVNWRTVVYYLDFFHTKIEIISFITNNNILRSSSVGTCVTFLLGAPKLPDQQFLFFCNCNSGNRYYSWMLRGSVELLCRLGSAPYMWWNLPAVMARGYGCPRDKRRWAATIMFNHPWHIITLIVPLNLNTHTAAAVVQGSSAAAPSVSLVSSGPCLQWL